MSGARDDHLAEKIAHRYRFRAQLFGNGEERLVRRLPIDVPYPNAKSALQRRPIPPDSAAHETVGGERRARHLYLRPRSTGPCTSPRAEPDAAVTSARRCSSTRPTTGPRHEGTASGESTPSARDRTLSRRRNGDAAVARRRRVRPVDRPGPAAPLQRREARGAHRGRRREPAHRRVRFGQGPGLRPAAAVHRLVPRRPQQRRRRRRDRGRNPGAARARPQRERGRRDHDRR